MKTAIVRSVEADASTAVLAEAPRVRRPRTQVLQRARGPSLPWNARSTASTPGRAAAQPQAPDAARPPGDRMRECRSADAAARPDGEETLAWVVDVESDVGERESVSDTLGSRRVHVRYGRCMQLRTLGPRTTRSKTV